MCDIDLAELTIDGVKLQEGPDGVVSFVGVDGSVGILLTGQLNPADDGYYDMRTTASGLCELVRP